MDRGSYNVAGGARNPATGDFYEMSDELTAILIGNAIGLLALLLASVFV